MDLHETTAELQPLAPISREAVRLRVDPVNWPEGLDPQQHLSAAPIHRALGDAGNCYTGFVAVAAAHAQDPKLTSAGVHEANVKWAEQHLPAMQKKLESIRESAASFEASRAKAVNEELGAAPIEPADVALAGEIRTWLRSLPDAARTSKIYELVQKGDRTALRAVLSAPAYLTGLDENLMGELRDHVFRAAKPERDALHQDFRKALVAAGRAVEGVIRYVQQETSPGRLRAAATEAVRLRSMNAPVGSKAA